MGGHRRVGEPQAEAAGGGAHGLGKESDLLHQHTSFARPGAGADFDRVAFARTDAQPNDGGRPLGIRAITINSTNRSEWPALQAEILGNKVDALLISPERLANDQFVEAVLLPVANRIGLMVVDEAHCISDWGHDFRPDYRRLVNILKLMPPNMPVLGTTATANNRVLDDVKYQLGGFEIQRGPLMRESLHLQTMRLADQAERLAWLARHIPTLPGTGESTP